MGQFDLLKQKRKVTPVISNVNQETVKNMKLRLTKKKEVNTECCVGPEYKCKTT